MVVGSTQTGKKIFALTSIDCFGEPELICYRYTIQDHFEAHCLFVFLSLKELAQNGPTPFYKNFNLLAQLHENEIRRTSLPLAKKEWYLSEDSLKYKRLLGQELAKKLL